MVETLKSELVWRMVFLTWTEAKGAIGQYIDSFTTLSGVIRHWTSSAQPRSSDTLSYKLVAFH